MSFSPVNFVVVEPVWCLNCQSINIVKHGKTDAGKQRYKCPNLECTRHSFLSKYFYRGYLPEVKRQISEMAVNGSRIRDPARVLKISRTTVIEELKKSSVFGPSESTLAATTLDSSAIATNIDYGDLCWFAENYSAPGGNQDCVDDRNL